MSADATPAPPPEIRLTVEQVLWFVDDALEPMRRIVEDLGDDRANRRPDLEGANSPYVILTHCLGVMEHWGGQMIAGREIDRDRDAEFRARGSVADLCRQVDESRHRFESDLRTTDPAAPPKEPALVEDVGTPLAESQSAVAIHVVRELYQHLGQMELSRDVIRSGSTMS